jgi:hypothetical protein
MPIIRRYDCVPLPIVVCPVVVVVMLESRVARCVHCVPLPIVVCPVVAVVMLESRVARCVHCVENVACQRQATVSTQCTQLATRLSSITTATTGHTNIGSGTQSDLLMMGIKMPETC